MKKLTAILVCLLLVASLAVTAFAAGTAEMTLTADKTDVQRGQTVVITFSISEVAGMKSAGFAMKNSYDANVFEFVEGAWVHSAPTSLAKVGVTGGILSGSAALSSATNVSGAIFQLTMKVKDNAPFGETSLTATGSARDTAALTVSTNTLKLNVVCASHVEKTEVTKAATCTAEGEKVTTCTACSATIKTEKIAKLAHTEKTEVTKAATCAAEGEKVTSCTVCQATIKTEKIAKLAHTYETKVTKEPTCVAEGEKTTACTACGDSKTEAIAKLAHTYETKVTKEPTCAAEGEKTTACTACGDAKTEKIEKLAHTFGEGVQTTAPTCAAEGVMTFTCSACNETKTEAIAKVAHTWDEGTVTTPATTKKEGIKTFKCTVCGAEKTESIPKTESPATADNSMIVPFVLLMVLSAAGVAVTVIGKKRIAR